MSDLKNKFISGVIWESFGRFSSLGIQFIVTVLIARVLTPSEFGIIGLLTIFIALSTILLDSGFSQALIQKKNATELDLSSVYYLNIFLGILIYVIMYIASPFIATFYDLPELTGYARVLFLIIPINSFGLIQNVIIQKDLAFKKTASASFFSALISGAVGIFMAYNGYGVWSLIGQQIALNLSKTLLYILQRRWLPLLSFSFDAIKEMFGFSFNLLLHSVVNVTMKNIYSLFIGKFYPVAQVGYYNQATRFEEISASTLTQVVIKVSFPALVHKKDNVELLKVAYEKLFATTIFFIAPLMALLMIIGEPLFQLLLTDKWLPAVPYFQILCLYGMVLPIIQISYNIYKLYRKGKMLLFIDTLRHILVIISILFTIKYSVDVMLKGLVIITIFMAIVNLFLSGKVISLNFLEQIKTLSPYYLFALIAGVLVLLIPEFQSNILKIFTSSFLFLIIYLFFMYVFKFKGFTEAVSIINTVKKKVL